jgi:pimeloyl-ACP methyl ester carboxylesterase
VVCSGWQPQRSVLEAPTAPTPNRVLVLGATHDPATPYAGAVALTDIMGNASLLTWEGTGHTALVNSPCIADHVARYLIELVVPAEGTHCPRS